MLYSVNVPQKIDRLDPAAETDITYEILTDGSCRGGDAYIIKTEVSYDGYAYYVEDRSDSIRVNNFRATLFNYSF